MGPEQGKLSSTEKIWRLLVRNVDDETEVLSLVRRGGEKRGCWLVMVRNVDNVEMLRETQKGGVWGKENVDNIA